MQQTEWWVSKVKIVLSDIKTKLLILLFFVAFLSACNSDKTNFSPGNLDSILENFHNTNSHKVLIAAHRASNTKYPENSLAAIQYSINTGVDILEIDIRTTKDGKLVLLHDATVNRTTNGKGKVSEFTYAELLELELDTKRGDTINHKIPLAEDVFKLAHGKIMIDLDIKDVFIKDLANLVHKTNTEKQVLFFDGSFDVLDSVLILDSTFMIMPRAHSLQDVNEIIERYHPPVIHIDSKFHTTEVVSTIKKSGARVWINALSKPDTKASFGLVNEGYSPLVENGANIIQTDLPMTLHKYLQKNKLR